MVIWLVLLPTTCSIDNQDEMEGVVQDPLVTVSCNPARFCMDEPDSMREFSVTPDTKNTIAKC